MKQKYCKECKTKTWHWENGICVRCKTIPEIKETKEKEDTLPYFDTDSITLPVTKETKENE